MTTCCTPQAQATCCEPEAKPTCCGTQQATGPAEAPEGEAPAACGCQ